MSMLGLRDLLLIAPNPSLHHHHHQQQQQQQPPQQDHSNLHPLPSSASLSVGLGIFPLLTATPCVPNDLPHDSADHNHQNTASNSNFWNLKMCPAEVPDSAKKGVIDVEGEENGILGVILGSVRIVGIAPRKIVGIDDAGLVARDVATIVALI
ncbi:hypothetical protein K1719_016169 [Acacia pycnantha]|nr:hypothetical protein K1719_016169 [Acacia pycnantha]